MNAHPTGRLPFSQIGGVAFIRGRRLAPLTRTAPKAALEAGIEQAQMVEPALFGDIDHFQISIPEQVERIQQTHFHPQCSHRNTEILLKQSIELTPVATKPLR